LETKSDTILAFCAFSKQRDVKILPVFIWEKESQQLQKYKELIKNDPTTLMLFCHTQDVLLHALSLNIIPSLEFAKAIPNMQPADVLDILPALLTQIPT